MNKILRNSIIVAIVLGTVGTSSFYNYTYAKGVNAVEEGSGAKADGEESVAMGFDAVAQDQYCITLGSLTNAKGKYSVGIGAFARVYKANSMAIGHTSRVYGENSIALGGWSVASGENEFSVGIDKDQNDSHPEAIYRRITHVADGTGDHDAVTLSQAKAFVNGDIDDTNTTSSVTGAKIKAELDKKMDKSALAGYAKSSDCLLYTSDAADE